MTFIGELRWNFQKSLCCVTTMISPDSDPPRTRKMQFEDVLRIRLAHVRA